MEAILNLLETTISYVGPFFVLLGLLIFVHELGHFLVAKYYGVKVEVFSLGFGKKIFEFIHGETNYCISLIPLGGYVKMYGDDPTKEVPEEMKDKAFLLKPVGARIAIVLAGPLMNLFFAGLVFSCVAFIGERLASPVVGDVDEASKAYAFGFRSGDKISSIKGHSVETWDEISEIIQDNPNSNVEFVVQRDGSEKIDKVSAQTILAKNPNLLSFDREIGKVQGLVPNSRAALIGVSNPKSPAGLAGFGAIELIKSINGNKIEFFRDLEPTLQTLANEKVLVFELQSYVGQLEPESEAPIRKVKIETDPIAGSTASSLAHLGFDSTDLFLYQVKKDSPAQEAGLRPGDKLLQIDSLKLKSWEDVVNSVKSYDDGDKAFEVKVLRQGEIKNISVVPKMTELIKPSGAEDNRFTIGIVPAIVSAFSEPVFIRHTNPITLVRIGAEKSWLWTKMVSVSFLRMLQNEVSSRNIGGVITIGKYAGQSYKVGIAPFLKLMAIISINLFILNLLPVPILDGGHLLFFTIEAIRGAPMSLKKMEMAQQVGLIILMTLMVFALFNDITNILNPPW